MKIVDNPFSRNLSEILGKNRVSKAEFLKILKNIHEKIKEKFPHDSPKNQVTEGSLKSYITGRRDPQLCNARKIADVLGVNMYDLFVDRDRFYPSESAIPREGIDKNKLDAIDSIISAIDVTDQHLIILKKIMLLSKINHIDIINGMLSTLLEKEKMSIMFDGNKSKKDINLDNDCDY